MQSWIPKLAEAGHILRHSGRGKHVGQFSYYHTSLIKQFPDAHRVIDVVRRSLRSPAQGYNVVKLNRNAHRISFLMYQDFAAPFPVLRYALSCRMENGGCHFTNYERRVNPPILHRKELLLPAGHPLVPNAELLTSRLEELGAFDNARGIGTRNGWNAVLKRHGLRLVDSQLVLE